VHTIFFQIIYNIYKKNIDLCSKLPKISKLTNKIIKFPRSYGNTNNKSLDAKDFT